MAAWHSERDELPDLYYAAGAACTKLLARPESWINRRVETIEMLTHEETRRRVSVDSLPEAAKHRLQIDDGLVVPVSVLTKEARRNFDLRDEAGRSVPVLGKQQNGALAHIALTNAALDAIDADVTSEVFGVLAADLRNVVFDPPAEAEAALRNLIADAHAGDPWRSAIVEDDVCRRLLETLWINYVLFAVLPAATENRRVLKYSYGDDFKLDPDDQPLSERLAPSELVERAWRPDRRRFAIDCPGAWRAASFHVEIAVPEELRIEHAVLHDRARDEPLSTVDVDVNRAALYASEPLDNERDTIAYAEVVPERAGRVSLSAATALVTAALLWVGVASGLDAENPGAAISLLLAGAAVFSGLVAAQGQHRIVQRAFAASRRWLTLLALAALSASATLAMEVPEQAPVGIWRVCAIICTVAALRLAWSAIRAPS